HVFPVDVQLRHHATLDLVFYLAIKAGVAFLQTSANSLHLLRSRHGGYGTLPGSRVGRFLGRLRSLAAGVGDLLDGRLLADPDDLPAVFHDADQFPAHDLAVLAGLDRVAAGLQADFLGPRPGDDEVRPVDLDADAGVIDLDDQ